MLKHSLNAVHFIPDHICLVPRQKTGDTPKRFTDVHPRLVYEELPDIPIKAMPLQRSIQIWASALNFLQPQSLKDHIPHTEAANYSLDRFWG